MSFVTKPRFPFDLAFALGLVVPLVHVSIANAQGTGGGAAPAGGGGGGSAAPASGGAPAGGGAAPGGGGTTITVTPGQTVYPGGVAPPPPGGTLGGGNAQYSSSKPITGNERDGFDFRGGSHGGGTVRGGEGSSFVLGQGPRASNPNANQHLVRRGDTLWGICDSYFHNPYQWPRIWSYNPQIQNPHWIYPGDMVRLRGGGPPEQAQPTNPALINRRQNVPPDTVFLRSSGYIDEEQNDWGEISGSREDKMILTNYDEVYLRIGSKREVKVGQELTVYRPVKQVAGGRLIEIQGTVKVDEWNPKERIARARITETMDAIERGARVAPIPRKFDVVPPARNDNDVQATILTALDAKVLHGQHQIVFIDKGEDAHLRPGNRLLVIRKGDAWHQSLTTRSSAKRIALEDESPAATEQVPRPRDESVLPEEVQAELRVVEVRKKTAMCIVTASRREIENGDKAYARKGY